MGVKPVVTSVIMVAVLFWASAARPESPPNFLEDVRVGEWVLYELEGGTLQKSTVIQVGRKEVLLKNETIRNGKVVKVNEEKLLIADGLVMYTGSGADHLRVEQSTAVVNGSLIPCLVVETQLRSMVIRLYISNLVPVMGLIKMETEEKNSSPLVRLIDYGFH